METETFKLLIKFLSHRILNSHRKDDQFQLTFPNVAEYYGFFQL